MKIIGNCLYPNNRTKKLLKIWATNKATSLQDNNILLNNFDKQPEYDYFLIYEDPEYCTKKIIVVCDSGIENFYQY